jgi:uncharacterized OB-fold protein
VTASTPVVEGLFTDTPDGPRLLGTRCSGCSTPYFPKAAVCRNPECAGGALEDARFGPSGTLWSYTIQHYAPPPPVKYDEPYAPYAMGMVDLDDGLRVLSRISMDDLSQIKVGATVELVVEKLHTSSDGGDVMTWKFRQTP